MSKSEELRIFYQILNKKKKQQLFPVTNRYEYELANNQHIKLFKRKLLYTKSRCHGIGLMACGYFYSIIRRTKPRVIIETGVDKGVSTVYILLALQKNGEGKLISIDKDADVGQLVPEELKIFWEQKVGKTYDVLPAMNINNIDIFIHDSLHTYENMLFEYRWVYPRLKDNGLLISHDIGTNNSFYDFANEIGKEVQYILTAKNRYGIGVITKGSTKNKFEDLLMENFKID